MKPSTTDRRSGFALITAAVMLAIAGVTVGSIVGATMTYRRNSDANYSREKAAFLADAGLRTALVKLNGFSEGNISYNQSRPYFAQTNRFTASDWGFNTAVTYTNSRNVLVSTGRYNGREVVVQAEVSLGAGSRSIHALYAHAMFAGNSSGGTNYVLQIGGTGTGADFVRGDVYSGKNIAVAGDAKLRLPEAFIRDFDNDGIYDPGTDTWQNAYAPQVFTNPLSQTAFNTYSNSMATNMSKVYNNGVYDEGEAFVDTIGNGVYDVGEPFVDANTNGVRDPGDTFIDRNGNGVYNAGVDTVVDNGNGVYNAGEEWTEDSAANRHGKRINGRYDPAGGYWLYSSGNWSWMTASYRVSGVRYYPNTWPAEAYEDAGDGNYNPSGETFTDRNGVYDLGEAFIDDRNSLYDYGTQAAGTISGMPSPGTGQRAATGNDAPVSAPNLTRMYYDQNRNGTEPGDALTRWGHDVAVTASDYSANGRVITSSSTPEHIFVRNVPQSSPGGGNDEYRQTFGGVSIRSRGYEKVLNNSGTPVDDYFLEDPTDSTYNTIPSGESLAVAKNDSDRTHTMLINVRPEDNVKLYYVDGNVYLHSTPTYAMRFRQPGTRITIVAKGNITISDEFYYNASYPTNLQYSAMNSTVVKNPSDALCLIALKNPSCTNSGNIYIGDTAMGTGGSIHAMLYAENDFVDNNINSVDQQFISVFGNMTAGNQVRLNRQVGSGTYRTRLDVTLDERIRDGSIIVPGLPHPVGGERSIQIDTAWRMVAGGWSSWSMLQ
jgi:hypothetical protein